MPSLTLGLVGAVWVWLRPPAFEAETGLVGIVLAGSLTAAGLLAGAWGLEHLLSSFRRASRLLERTLSRVPLSLPVVVGLALATSASEELLFRGALLSWLGVWPQALLFGLFHPVPLRAWGYQAYTVVAGLAFGYLTLATGSLWAALLAHFIVNLIGLGQVWWTQRGRRRRRLQRGPPRDGDDATPLRPSP